jgi:hypothetical protein
MKKEQKNNLWVRIVCWFLAMMMLLGGATYTIYAILGLL